MIEILLISLFTFLAFYGLLHIVTEFVSRTSRILRKRGNEGFQPTAITPEDNESDIEEKNEYIEELNNT